MDKALDDPWVAERTSTGTKSRCSRPRSRISQRQSCSTFARFEAADRQCPRSIDDHTLKHTKVDERQAGSISAFICYYAKIHGVAPAEADFRRYFQVSPPVVHQMILTLETRGFIEREPGKSRSIKLRLTRAELPDLG